MIATSADEQRRLAALLERVAAGDQAALAQLYDLTSPILYGLMLRMLRQPERAQEALQDCYLRVWHRAETYCPAKGEPIAWLIGVARYRALDALRGQRVVDTAPASLESGAVALEVAGQDFEPGPEDRAVEREGEDVDGGDGEGGGRDRPPAGEEGVALSPQRGHRTRALHRTRPWVA